MSKITEDSVNKEEKEEEEEEEEAKGVGMNL